MEKIKILITGDFCAWERVEKLVTEKKYTDVFTDFNPILQQADYRIVDFEAPVVSGKAVPIRKSGPHLRTGKAALEAVKQGGFNLLTLANNHFYDYGDTGVKETLNVCLELGLDTVGGGENITQARQVFYKEINGKKFGFVNVCEHEFSIATDEHGGSNPLDVINNYYQIREARQQADYVVVIVHGGHEMYPLPSPRMKATYRYFAEIGADVVINHHQHCYSGYELYKGVPIFYGLGNFSFDWKKKRNGAWNEGYAVTFSFEKDVVSFELHPFIQGNEHPGVRLMKNAEMERFNKTMLELNKTISNDKALSDSFTEWIQHHRKSILSYFEPYNNRYVRVLYRYHVLPSFIGRKKQLIILNMIRCEAHRDTVCKALDK